MTPRTAPVSLGSGLTPREHVSDADLRFVQALDQNSESLLRSALTLDATVDISGLSKATGLDHPPQEGIETIIKGVLAHVGPMDSSHHLSNFRVKLNGRQNEAEVYCYALAQHFRKGEGGEPKNREYLLFGNTYTADVVKDEDEDIWRIR